MANILSNPIQGLYTDAVSKIGQTQRVAVPNVLQNAYQSPQAQITASNGYRMHQMEMLNFLQQLGFSQEQISKLSQFGNLSFEQYSRVVLIAQGLDKAPEVFDGFLRSLKSLVSRGQNVETGGKGYLDGLDRLLGFDSRKIIEGIFSKYHPFQQHSGEENGDDEASQKLNRMPPEVKDQFRKIKTQIERTMNNLGGAALQEYIDFASTSIDEFPTRYHVDLYSFNQLAERGVSVKEYVELASEVSPTRLVNLLAAAEKSGKNAAAILDTLREAMRNGENLSEVVAVLEKEFQAKAPKAVDAQSTIPVTAGKKEITLTSGQNLKLAFTALDSHDGVLDGGVNSFVLFPQREIFPGNEFNLGQLPPGLYFLLARSQNTRNEPMNMWVKVIVNEKQKKDDEKPDDQQEDEKQSEQDSKREQKSEENPKLSAEVIADFNREALVPSGPFLGQVTLPLDYLDKEAQDLVAVSPATGMIIDRDEFLAGRFVSHAVTFRFLTDRLASPMEIKRRHGLLKLNASDVFNRYDVALKRFARNPQAGLNEWKLDLARFFDDLGKLFPAGEKTFEVARGLFERESESYARGEAGTYYKTTSNENREGAFLTAFYAKGSYAMAYAGEVNGALFGMSSAAMCNLSDADHQAVLGEYLSELRKQYFTKLASDKMRDLYGVHISHAFADHLTADPSFRPDGEDFIKAAVLPLPPAKPQTVSAANAGYGVYRVGGP